MNGFFAFSVLLVLAVLLSARFHRTLLSASVLFLGGGLLVGGLGLAHVSVDSPALAGTTRTAVVAVLFTDAMGSNVRELQHAWRLPGRALLLGLPLTVLGLALLARSLLGFSWRDCFLLGAILSPTDPVLSSAIVGREAVPRPLRTLLNVESGVNDGLALPLVVALLPNARPDAWKLILEVLGGVLVGIAVPWLVLRLKSLSFFKVRGTFAPLVALAIAACTFATASLLQVSDFLAAFAAGVTVTTLDEDIRADFAPLGQLVIPLLKLGTIFLFGLVVSGRSFELWNVRTVCYALLAIIVVRPLSIFLAMVKSTLEPRLRLIAAWFGPKGFASILFGLVLIHHSGAKADPQFQVIALVVVCSILAHSTSDVPIARRFEKRERT